MAENFLNNLLEAAIVIGVIGGIALVYYAKVTKQDIKTVIKKVFSMRLFKGNEEDLYENKNKQKMQESIQQTWPERRTIM